MAGAVGCGLLRPRKARAWLVVGVTSARGFVAVAETSGSDWARGESEDEAVVCSLAHSGISMSYGFGAAADDGGGAVGGLVAARGVEADLD